jgi:hypothetical protein
MSSLSEIIYVFLCLVLLPEDGKKETKDIDENVISEQG